MAWAHRGFRSRAHLSLAAAARAEEASAAGWLTIAEADNAPLRTARCARIVMRALQLSSRR